MGWYQRRVHGECWSGGDRRDTENWKFGGLSRLQSEKTVRIFDKLFCCSSARTNQFPLLFLFLFRILEFPVCLGFKKLYLSAFDIQTLNICQLKKNCFKQTNTVEA